MKKHGLGVILFLCLWHSCIAQLHTKIDTMQPTLVQQNLSISIPVHTIVYDSVMTGYMNRVWDKDSLKIDSLRISDSIAYVYEYLVVLDSSHQAKVLWYDTTGNQKSYSTIFPLVTMQTNLMGTSDIWCQQQTAFDHHANSIISQCQTGSIYHPKTSSTLPLDWLGIKGICKDNESWIQWHTARESNLSFFSLQESLDGINWQIIKKINAKNTSSAISQWYTAKITRKKNIRYYRIIANNIDMSQNISSIIALDCGTKVSNIIVYPNPTFGNVHILLQEYSDAVLCIYDAKGRKIQTKNINKEESLSAIPIDLSMIQANGVYTIHVQTKTQKHIISLVIIRE